MTFLRLSFRLQRKRPHSPPLITSTPIQKDVTSTPVEDGTAMNGVKEGAECEVGAPPPVKKRLDYLQWEEYFMAVAFLSAQRSKDPNSQVRTQYDVYDWCCLILRNQLPLPHPQTGMMQCFSFIYFLLNAYTQTVCL